MVDSGSDDTDDDMPNLEGAEGAAEGGGKQNRSREALSAIFVFSFVDRLQVQGPF